jgi:uncharacterized protein
MYRPTLAILTSLLTALFAFAQAPAAPAPPAAPADFHGAVPILAQYRVVYEINSGDDQHIRGALKNVENALSDPRLKDKLEVELVVYGAGVAVFRKDQPYEDLLLGLQKKGVVLAQCENTMRERQIRKDELWPFISFVPSGNGEIIIRAQQGWAVVHP